MEPCPRGVFQLVHREFVAGIAPQKAIQRAFPMLGDARDSYGVTKRTLLAIRALFDGQISFADVFGR